MTRERCESTTPVAIELGEICEKKTSSAGNVYKVKSCTRDGVVSRWMEAVNAGVNEYTGEPPSEQKCSYAVGLLVYFFMFSEGGGMVLGPAKKDL